MHDLPRSFISYKFFTNFVFPFKLLSSADAPGNPSNSLAIMGDCVAVKTDQNLDIVNMLKDVFLPTGATQLHSSR